MDVELEVSRQLDLGNYDGATTAALRGYGAEVLGYLNAVVRDPELVDEAFAQFSEDLWKSMATFRRESTAKTWCYRLAWHTTVRLLRDPYRKRNARLETSEWSKMAEKIRTSTAAHVLTDVKDGIARLREQLTPDEQTLLILRVDRDLPWKAVAEVMSDEEGSLTEASLRKRFERIKDRLRELARAEGLLED